MNQGKSLLRSRVLHLTIVTVGAAVIIIGFILYYRPRYSCEALPPKADFDAAHLEASVTKLSDDVQRIDGGLAWLETERCPGRVGLHILYNGEPARSKLEAAHQASTLRDIPVVRWQNN